MESLGAIFDGEWNNTFSGLYSCNEESDFMVQLLGNSSSFPNRAVTSLTGVLGESSNCYSSDNNTPGYFSCVQFPIVFGDEDFYQNDSRQFLALYDNNNNNNNNNFMSIDFCVGDEEKNMGMLNESLANRDISSSSIEESAREANSNLKKRPRTAEVENKRNLKGKKNKKALCRKSNNNDEENNVVANRPSLSSCDSENESNEGVSSSLVLNSNGKSRAVRGSASDPQSLYARKRRERINERLRILQSLVPNGTKVDISTMLEEAVQYVKFLQLQIKLLSSDDMWMYAPLAYNGMDIGLGMKVNAPNS